MGWCWHPKKTALSLPGLPQLKYKVRTGQTPVCFFPFCKFPGEKNTVCMSRASKHSILVLSVYSTGNQTNIEKGRTTLCRWDAGCLMSVTVTIASGWLSRMCWEFISSQRQLCTYLFSKIISLKNMLNEKCAEWVAHKETPKNCVSESQGRENRQMLIKD